MASPTADSYTVASGQGIYAGMYRVQPFDSVSVALETANGLPGNTANKVLVMQLHESGGYGGASGREYDAVCSGLMAYESYNVFRFKAVLDSNPNILKLRPKDYYDTAGGKIRESAWLGFTNMGTPDVTLITQRRMDAMMQWANAGNIDFVPKKTCLQGGSMGGWGTMTYGIRRPELFAAIYPDRPRWRYTLTPNSISVATWTPGGFQTVLASEAPDLRPEDGGGSMFEKVFDCISYVADTNNKIPWMGWCIGRNDGYMAFSDHIDAVAAMRAAKRGFAFAWNDGNHSGGPTLTGILSSYPYGTFELGKGYPLFTNHSGDQDPAVDISGGINIGLSFRNVVESAGSWSCEVTSILGARTVTVEPISEVFTASVTPQEVEIPAANTWVAVTFSA